MMFSILTRRVALRFARRHWHRLGGALVQVPVKQRTPTWLEAWEAMYRLDHASS
jgi:hypothetical protein